MQRAACGCARSRAARQEKDGQKSGKEDHYQEEGHEEKSR
jgi:hypothetical protein